MNHTIDVRTSPDQYRHWLLEIDGDIATLKLNVDEDGGLYPGYLLKLNSYDLGVDIELADAVNRLRFEFPQVKAVVLTSAKDNVFCAGANIRMLSTSSHCDKVNFCKFTNETRLAIEEASEYSRQTWLTAINGPAAGGGYELAAATDHIILIDDSNTSVSLPEVPLLAVLPGTGGLTRLVDKRGVRRDRADVFCTTEEGLKGSKAEQWGLVDELAPRSQFDAAVRARARELASQSDRPSTEPGIALQRIEREITETRIGYTHIEADIDRDSSTVTILVHGPKELPPETPAELQSQGATCWPVAAARELDDLLMHLRLNEPALGLFVLKTHGASEPLRAWDSWLHANRKHWLIRETLLLWKRTLKRLDLSARTLFALIESDSCFIGLLAELSFAADRCYMFESDDENDGPFIELGECNFGQLPMSNGLTRLQTRFIGEPESVDAARSTLRQPLGAQRALELGLVTEIYDDIDWDDEIRIAIEQRASFSADSLTAMEANLRFAGPETMETKIFGRLTAWQNWVFQRPNAVGDRGALNRYGTGERPDYDKERT